MKVIQYKCKYSYYNQCIRYYCKQTLPFLV